MEGGVVYKGAQGDLSRDKTVPYTGCSNDFTIVCICQKLIELYKLRKVKVRAGKR